MYPPGVGAIAGIDGAATVAPHPVAAGAAVVNLGSDMPPRPPP